uniref:Uncharacterized protein n=1 Tax=Globisporangium ultimum (strain ATCC 200006 / CBS 805.95 / DAOM BR144) TaxID=431595 RepID=K3X5E0_GLOUD
MLNDLVVCRTSAITNDLGHTGGRASFDRESVFENIVPPHVLDCAVTLFTVDAFTLILADDDVLERGVWLDKERRGRFARFFVTGAFHIRSLVGLP